MIGLERVNKIKSYFVENFYSEHFLHISLKINEIFLIIKLSACEIFLSSLELLKKYVKEHNTVKNDTMSL